MRLLNVSNRLPLTVTESANEFQFQSSMGGLVTGLGAYIDKKKQENESTDSVWIGWPGSTISEDNQDKLRKICLKDHQAYPVYFSAEAMDKFYHGFCNKTIWPLFHYFPSYTFYEEDLWLEYKDVNQIFADAVLNVYKDGDIIWIHDYHLMLLPAILRKKLPATKIGFFLHIPFPSLEIYRLLPSRWRSQILEGLLGSNLLGFHTHDYTQYFMGCVSRIIGLENDFETIHYKERMIRALTFPMGIDYEKFSSESVSEEITEAKEMILRNYPEQKIILSIDRLDYSKGIHKRLQGYERFLKLNPEWIGKVVLIAVVVPSRVAVDQYQEMKRQIDEIVGKINGQYGSMTWTPINYQYTYLPHKELVSLYRACDVALITPLRDGMNLVAKEYIASRSDGKGVLIISEMAGVSKEMAETIVINPNNRTEIANAIKQALEMPIEEQERIIRRLQTRIKRYNVVRWADDFITELLKKPDRDTINTSNLMTAEDKNRLVADFKKSSKRFIFLDYDGTLVPFVKNPEDASPNKELMTLLENLCALKNTTLTIISGRNREFLDKWLGQLPVNLVSEHGAWIKLHSQKWKQIKQLASKWKEHILPVMERYSDLLPGSFIEEKEFSIVWHYRMADIEHISIKKKELIDDLVNFTANKELQVLQGNKVVEVRNSGVNKGYAVLDILSDSNPDFILAAGDDTTDEDIFNVLSHKNHTIKVGTAPTRARFSVNDLLDLQNILKELCNEQ